MRPPMPPELRPKPTSAQGHAQDETVRVLDHFAREAEAYLAARTAEARDQARDALCPCGVALRACQCPLRQAKRAAPGIS